MPDKKHGLGKGMGALFGDFYDREDELVEKIVAIEGQKKKAAVPSEKKPVEEAAKSGNKTKAATVHAVDSAEPGRPEGVEGNAIRAVYVPITSISPNPNQPRKTFDEESLNELAVSIKEQGIIQPLIVEEIVPGRYSIVAGERRFRAAEIAGLDKLPVIIMTLTEIQRIQMSLIENVQREDLNPIEEAYAYQYLIQRSNMTQEEVAAKVGKSRSAIANSIRLLGLSDKLKDDVISGQLTAGHARAILSLVNPADQQLLREKIIDNELSVREAERLADEYNKGHKVEPKKKGKEEDPEISEVVERFVSAVGSRCEIKGNLDKGRLLIKYRSQQDLERIYSLISGGDALFD